MSLSPRPIVLAAGGTGGHMMPAYALAVELERRGHACRLVTDERGGGVPGIFGRMPRHVFDSGRMTGGPLRKAATIARLARNVRRLRRLLRETHPVAVVGFGGYPAMSAVLAARLEHVPSVLHEQNAVLGRANRLLARWAERIALSFERTHRLPRGVEASAVYTGNPVRAEVARLAGEPYPPFDEDGMMRLLVLGGSLGARVLSEVVPDALSLLPPHLRKRLQVSQQCRAEDLERARQRYADAGIAADLAPFFEDVPERLHWAHLVIARAGASTLAELTCAGRPAILVPLPIATDDHQTANAAEMVKAGGGWGIPQGDFTASSLAKRIQALARAPNRLQEAACASKSLGDPDAAFKLADLVEDVIAATAGDKAGAEDENDTSDTRPETHRREALA